MWSQKTSGSSSLNPKESRDIFDFMLAGIEFDRLNFLYNQKVSELEENKQRYWRWVCPIKWNCVYLTNTEMQNHFEERFRKLLKNV